MMASLVGASLFHRIKQPSGMGGGGFLGRERRTRGALAEMTFMRRKKCLLTFQVIFEVVEEYNKVRDFISEFVDDDEVEQTELKATLL